MLLVQAKLPVKSLGILFVLSRTKLGLCFPSRDQANCHGWKCFQIESKINFFFFLTTSGCLEWTFKKLNPGISNGFLFCECCSNQSISFVYATFNNKTEKKLQKNLPDMFFFLEHKWETINENSHKCYTCKNRKI